MAVAKESQNDRTDVKDYVHVLLYQSILIYLHVTIRAGLFQSWLMLSQLNLYTNVFTFNCFCLCFWRLFKLRTESQTIYMSVENQNFYLSLFSKIGF